MTEATNSPQSSAPVQSWTNIDWTRLRMANPPIRLGMGLALIGAATAGRLGLGLIDPGSAPFMLYFPAILLAAFLGGWRVGAASAAASIAIVWILFIAPTGDHSPLRLAVEINLILYAVTCAAMVATAGHVGGLVERLAKSRSALDERNRQYRVLFEMMSEGFALCEAIRDRRGYLIDYIILEMNPALQRMLGVGPEVVGGRFSETPGDQSAWLARCARVIRTGASEAFEFHNRATGRWHEIHLNRVTQTQMSQFFFDITERKTAELHQTLLFEELNHRVKNNLGVVSAILEMQARRAEGETRAGLLKAVGRVQSIADVHECLSIGGGSGSVDFSDYLRRLCERIGSVLSDGRIQIVVEAQPLAIPTEHAVQLGMVVNELITNAIKYAYPAPTGGVIEIRIETSDQGAVLSVSDSGPGLSENNGKAAGGLGFPLVHSMVRQVGGTLSIRSHPGTTFEIFLPQIQSELR